MSVKQLAAYVILFFSSMHAHATYCTYGSLNVALPSGFTYQGASGGMISASWHEASNATLMNCDVTGAGKFEITSQSLLVASGVYSFGGNSYTPLQTATPNISFIMDVADTFGVWQPYQGQPLTTFTRVGAMSNTFGLKVRIRLIATGRLEPGSHIVPAGNFMSTGVTQGALYTGSAFTKTTGTVVTSKSPTCKLSVAANYNLPSVLLSEIPRVNSVAGATGVSFSATCGGAPSAYNVKYSLVDVNNSVAGANYIALRTVGSADDVESVGLQLTDGATTMQMGTIYSFGQVAAAGGTLSKTLQVSYVRRTMTAPVPGPVFGGVALVFSYD